MIVSVTFVFNLKHIFISMEPNRTEIGQWATACKTLLINDGRLQVARQSSPTPSIISQFSCGNKNTRKSNTVSIDQQTITINYVGRPKTVVFIAIIRRWHSGFCLARWIVSDTLDCVWRFVVQCARITTNSWSLADVTSYILLARIVACVHITLWWWMHLIRRPTHQHNTHLEDVYTLLETIGHIYIPWCFIGDTLISNYYTIQNEQTCSFLMRWDEYDACFIREQHTE